MAFSAEIALSTFDTAATGQRVTAFAPILNDGAADLLLTELIPVVTPNEATPTSIAVAVGAVFPRLPINIPAGQTVNVGFTVCPQAPGGTNGLASPATITYEVGALMRASDGTLVAASPASFDTVSSLSQASPD